jgi:hypothetical protein
MGHSLGGQLGRPGARAQVHAACANGVVELSGCSPRITSSGPPSRHSLSGAVASCEMLRPMSMRSTDMRRAEMPPATAATHATNRDLTTPPGSLGRNSWPGWARSFRSSALGCGGDIRLIAFITEPGAIRKILTHLGEPLEPPLVSPARGPPTDWGELVQVHFRPGDFSGVTRRAARHRHPQPLMAFHATERTAREKSGFKAGSSRREKSGLVHGEEAPRPLEASVASSPASPGCCSS